jgi:hypothetical protein
LSFESTKERPNLERAAGLTVHPQHSVEILTCIGVSKYTMPQAVPAGRSSSPTRITTLANVISVLVVMTRIAKKKAEGGASTQWP